MSIEDQIRTIAKEEQLTQMDEIEKRMKNAFRNENIKLKEIIDSNS